MTSPTNELQRAYAAALLADAGVLALVANSKDGRAVFAVGQDFADVFDRLTFTAPQRLDVPNSCSTTADMLVTLHSWARGADCTLKAGALADAAIDALLATTLEMTGWRVSSRALLASRPVGDPDPSTEHFVSELRFTVHRNG
jgi:hypothetical protein